MTLSEAITAANRDLGKTATWARSRLRDELGPEPLDKLTRTTLIRWALSRTGSKHTTALLLRCLSGILSDAQDLLDAGPGPTPAREALRVLTKTKRLPTVAQRSHRATDAQLAAIMAAWPDTHVPSQIVPFAVASTLRVSEIVALTWDAIGHDTITVKRAKTGDVGQIAILPAARDALDAAPRNLPGPFTTTPSSASHAFRRAARAAGHGHLCFHSLRHEGITRLFERGLTIPQVAVQSGHRSWQNLARYTHATPQSVLAAY